MSFLQTTGRYYWDFSVNGTNDVTVVGTTGASIIQQTDGISLVQTASSDIKAKLILQRASTYNAIITMDCTCVGGTGNIGVCFRTTSFNTANDSYAWYFGLSTGGWTLGTGSDSNYSNWKQRASGTGNYTGRHTLKVVINNGIATGFIDDVQVFNYTISSYYNYYGYIIPRAYAGDNTDRIHSLEILSTSIPDPTIKNINRMVKILFDRDVHFPYADMSGYANAFTATFQQRDWYYESLYQKTITAVDLKHAKDSNGNDVLNTIIVYFSLDDCFRKAESDVTMYFDSSKCLIYGKYIKDKLANFNISFTPVNIDKYQNPHTFDSINPWQSTSTSIVCTPIHSAMYQQGAESVNLKQSNSNTITPTLVGVIKP